MESVQRPERPQNVVTGKNEQVSRSSTDDNRAKYFHQKYAFLINEPQLRGALLFGGYQ